MIYPFISLVLLGALFVNGSHCRHSLSVYGVPEPTPPRSKENGHDLVDYCKSLCPNKADSYRKYIIKLADKNDFQALRAIYNSDFTFSSWAAGEAARVMNSSKVVEFCQQFELGSANWQEALMALRYHPKKHVISYVKKCATQGDPLVRYFCYKLCLNTGWDDLAEKAKEDLHSDAGLGFPNLPDQSLANWAKFYLEKCAASKGSGNERKRVSVFPVRPPLGLGVTPAPRKRTVGVRVSEN
jgi:hypothetical protein